MATWLIDGATPESLGVRSINISYRSQDADEVTIGLKSKLTGSTPFAKGSVVNITEDGTRVFRGHVTGRANSASGSAEGAKVTLKGPWHFLASIPWFTQEAYADGSTKWVPKVSIQGATVAVICQVGANGLPAYSSAGTMNVPSLVAPYYEAEGMTIADVIRGALKYFPGATARFDYTQTPPKLYVTSADPSALSDIAYTGLVLSDVRARDDLKLSGVVLYYDQKVARKIKSSIFGTFVDSTVSHRLLTDAYPVGIDASAAITPTVMTKRMLGNSTVAQVVTETTCYDANTFSQLFVDGPVGFHTYRTGWQNFWSRFGVSTSGVAGTSGTTYYIERWLSDPPASGFTWANMRPMSSYGTSGNKITTINDAFFSDPAFPAANIAWAWVRINQNHDSGNHEVVCLCAHGTGAGTKTHTTYPSPIGSSNSVAGAAEALYRARQLTVYDGQVRVSGPLADMLMKNSVTVEGTRMGVIQRLDYDVFRAEATLTLGPGEHLGPQDYIALLRPIRG
jgi:hypothetical protein